MTWMRLFVSLAFAITPVLSYGFDSPDPNSTPGKVCTSDDPDFSGYEYSAHVAKCKRHVTASEKQKVAHLYGDIPKSEWSKYEFDHLIPLCAGGANSIENLWPQPLAQAKKKDVVEDDVCAGLRDGSMSQKEAIQEIWDWFDSLDKEG